MTMPATGAFTVSLTRGRQLADTGKLGFHVLSFKVDCVTEAALDGLNTSAWKNEETESKSKRQNCTLF
jgi:hypothetical protein